MSRHLELRVAVLMVHISKEVCICNWVWIGNITIPKKELSLPLRRGEELSYHQWN